MTPKSTSPHNDSDDVGSSLERYARRLQVQINASDWPSADALRQEIQHRVLLALRDSLNCLSSLP